MMSLAIERREDPAQWMGDHSDAVKVADPGLAPVKVAVFTTTAASHAILTVLIPTHLPRQRGVWFSNSASRVSWRVFRRECFAESVS